MKMYLAIGPNTKSTFERFDDNDENAGVIRDTGIDIVEYDQAKKEEYPQDMVVIDMNADGFGAFAKQFKTYDNSKYATYPTSEKDNFWNADVTNFVRMMLAGETEDTFFTFPLNPDYADWMFETFKGTLVGMKQTGEDGYPVLDNPMAFKELKYPGQGYVRARLIFDAKEPSQTQKEQLGKYIGHLNRELVKKENDLNDTQEEEIAAKLVELEAQIESALEYESTQPQYMDDLEVRFAKALGPDLVNLYIYALDHGVMPGEGPGEIEEEQPGITDPIDKYEPKWVKTFSDEEGSIGQIPTRLIVPYAEKEGLEEVLGPEGYVYLMRGFYNDDSRITIKEIEDFKTKINEEKGLFQLSKYFGKDLSGLYETPEKKLEVSHALDLLVAHMKTTEFMIFDYEPAQTDRSGPLKVSAFVDKDPRYMSFDLHISDDFNKSAVVRLAKVYDEELHSGESGQVKGSERTWTVNSNNMELSDEDIEIIKSQFLMHIASR